MTVFSYPFPIPQARLLDPKLRDFFDLRLEQVLASLPEGIRALLDRVPLHVEDHPSDEILRAVGVRSPAMLCGLHSGIPLTEQNTSAAWTSAVDPNVVTIYRQGVLHAACDDQGELHEDELLRQIRITVLHEMGHYHGLDEDDLDELGYG